MYGEDEVYGDDCYDPHEGLAESIGDLDLVGDDPYESPEFDD